MKSQPVLIVLLALVLAYFARAVFVPIFLALFLTMLLEPLVRGLSTRGIQRPAASLLVTTFFVLGTVLAGWYLYRSVMGIAAEMPLYAERIREIFSGLHATSDKIEESTRTLSLGSQVSGPGIQQVQLVDRYPLWMRYLMEWVGSIYEVVTVALFVPLLIFYMLLEKENLLESFNGIAARFCYLPKLNSELPKIIRAFVRGNAFTALFLIAAHAIVFRSIGLEHWIPLAIFSGFLNLLPLVGAPLALVLPFAQGVIQFSTPGPFVILAGALVAFHFLSNNFLLPYFMTSLVNVNTVTLLSGLLFWGWLWGAMGFVLAIPMTALLKALLESNAQTYAVANLFAARPRHLIPWSHRDSEAGEKPGLARSHSNNLKTVDVDEATVRELQRRDHGQA
jgi:predicted PurR-regulated permease PerM